MGNSGKQLEILKYTQIYLKSSRLRLHSFLLSRKLHRKPDWISVLLKINKIKGIRLGRISGLFLE